MSDAADDAEIDLTGGQDDVAADEAGQVEIDLDEGGAVEDQGQSRRLVAQELGGVDRGLDRGLRARGNHLGPDPNVGAAALGSRVGDADLLVGAIDQRKCVANLRAAGHRAEVIGSFGKGRGDPVKVLSLHRRARDRDHHSQKPYQHRPTHQPVSLPSHALTAFWLIGCRLSPAG